MDRIAIARVAHEINRAYCASLGDTSQPAWEDAPEWQKNSALVGVDMHLAKPDATPEQSHESWLAQKLAEGWKHGPVKDAEKKEHPCCVPYADLPAEQKAKDYLFRGVVHALKAIEPAQAVVSVAPAIPDAPQLRIPLGSNDPTPVVVMNNTPDVSRDLSNRRLAHIVTGGVAQ